MTSWGATARGDGLIHAASLGRIEDVEGFLKAGPDLARHRRQGAPPAPDDHWPADSAHLPGDVSSDALYGAPRNGHANVVVLLLDRGASVDAKGVFGGTALHWPAMNGHRATVASFSNEAADRGVRDVRFGSTAAEWAVEGGHPEIAAMIEGVR